MHASAQDSTSQMDGKRWRPSPVVAVITVFFGFLADLVSFVSSDSWPILFAKFALFPLFRTRISYMVSAYFRFQ
jgi:hypothetical protein